MNKKLVLLTLLFPLLAACNMSKTYFPRVPYAQVAGEPGEGGDTGDTGGSGDSDERLPMTVYFFLDYSHSEEGDEIFELEWKQLTPLGECPEEALLTDENAPDPLYPHFIGYSEYPSCMDETLLWDFAKDDKQSNILNLYGIWVSR